MEYRKRIIKNIVLSAGIILIAFSAMAGLGWDMQSRAEKVQAARNEISADSQSFETTAQLQNDFEKAKKIFPQMQTFLINRDDLLNLPKELDFIAKQSGLGAALNFRDETPPTETISRKTGLSLSLEGGSGVAGLVKFFEMVEKSRYFIKFSNLDINQDGSKIKAGLVGAVSSF